MTVETKKENSTLTIIPTGEINTLTTPNVEKAVSDLSGVEELVFDMEKVPFISSACLRLLLSCLKKMKASKGSLRIINSNEFLREIFESVGFDRIFSIS